VTQRWDWTYRYGRRLLVASVVTVAVLTGALVAVVALGARGTDCVVGTWRTVHSEQRLSGGLGTLILDGDGPVERYEQDGTGGTDYGDGVTYRVVDTPGGLVDGTELAISGTATYSYELDGGVIRYDEISSNLTQTSEYFGDVPTNISDEPFGYRCEGDTLTFQIGDRYQAELARLD
jgi:hypothetical protein